MGKTIRFIGLLTMGFIFAANYAFADEAAQQSQKLPVESTSEPVKTLLENIKDYKYAFNLGVTLGGDRIDATRNFNQGSLAHDVTDNPLSPYYLYSTPHYSLKLEVVTKDEFFGDSKHFGYFNFTDIRNSRIDHACDVGGTSCNSNTAVGSFSPIDSYLWEAGIGIFGILGDKEVINSDDAWQIKFGAGVGAGYLSIKGTLPAAYSSVNADQNLDISSLGSSLHFFTKYSWSRGWFFQVDVYGTRTVIPGACTSTYVKNNATVTKDLGYCEVGNETFAFGKSISF